MLLLRRSIQTAVALGAAYQLKKFMSKPSSQAWLREKKNVPLIKDKLAQGSQLKDKMPQLTSVRTWGEARLHELRDPNSTTFKVASAFLGAAGLGKVASLSSAYFGRRQNQGQEAGMGATEDENSSAPATSLGERSENVTGDNRAVLTPDATRAVNVLSEKGEDPNFVFEDFRDPAARAGNDAIGGAESIADLESTLDAKALERSMERIQHEREAGLQPDRDVADAAGTLLNSELACQAPCPDGLKNDEDLRNKSA